MAKTNTAYTAEQTVAMVADYKAGVSVNAIAENMGKTARSVIAKLSREGVYNKPKRLTKTGEPVTHKDALSDEIGMLLGMTEAEVTSLEKANKTALAKILAAVKLTDANDIS